MNADEQLKQRERISALADGQLTGPEFTAAVELTAADEDARACWHMYHLVGDVLRSGDLGTISRDRDFLARLRHRIQVESAATESDGGTLSDPKSIATYRPFIEAKEQSEHVSVMAANDSQFRWKLVAGLASLAAVAALSFSAIGTWESPAGGGPLAQAGAVPNAPVPPPVLMAGESSASPLEKGMIRDRRLDELMSAHRQFGGNSALQNPSGFLRNATFEGASR